MKSLFQQHEYVDDNLSTPFIEIYHIENDHYIYIYMAEMG